MNSYSLYTTDTYSTGILLCRAIQKHMERFGELLVMIKSNDMHTYTPRPIDYYQVSTIKSTLTTMGAL